MMGLNIVMQQPSSDGGGGDGPAYQAADQHAFRGRQHCVADAGILPGVGGRTGLPGVQRPLRFGGAVCGERSINGHI